MQDLVTFRCSGGHSPHKRRYVVCPGGSTPLDFSARCCTNELFHSFMFVYAIDTRKTRFGTMWHIVAPDIPAAGHFHLNVQKSAKCYRPNVRKVTPGSYALQHLVNHTFHHTSTQIQGPHARFGGIPVVWRSFPPENGGMCAPAGLPP